MDRKTVERVARTAHLRLTDAETEKFGQDLEQILDWFRILDDATGLDGEGVNPIDVSDILREDIPSQEFSQDDLLKDMKTYNRYVRGPKLS